MWVDAKMEWWGKSENGRRPRAARLDACAKGRRQRATQHKASSSWRMPGPAAATMACHEAVRASEEPCCPPALPGPTTAAETALLGGGKTNVFAVGCSPIKYGKQDRRSATRILRVRCGCGQLQAESRPDRARTGRTCGRDGSTRVLLGRPSASCPRRSYRRLASWAASFRILRWRRERFFGMSTSIFT